MPLIRKMTLSSQSLPWWRRVGWMALIWAASVLALFAVSMLLRIIMAAAGLKLH